MLSVPGVLVSRDRTIRRYVGHSSKSGELYGRYAPDGPGWQSWCERCGDCWTAPKVRPVAYLLAKHWQDTHSIDRCVKCGGPDGFHDPACVVHPMDHQPTEQEQG